MLPFVNNMRFSSQFSMSFIAILLAFASNELAKGSTLTLSGISEFSSNSSGNASSVGRWNTVGGDVPYNLYVVEGNDPTGSFLNKGNNAQLTTISINLSPGIYTFFLWADPGALAFVTPAQNLGMNLFFGGSTTTPGISVFGNTIGNFAADSGSTVRLNALTAQPGAGTLQYTSGNLLVTLSNFSFSDPNSTNGNRVAGYKDTKNGAFDQGNDYVSSFTLDVTGIPEPNSLPVVVMGLAAVLFFTRRRILRS
jgi:hypothetical protein